MKVGTDRSPDLCCPNVRTDHSCPLAWLSGGFIWWRGTDAVVQADFYLCPSDLMIINSKTPHDRANGSVSYILPFRWTAQSFLPSFSYFQTMISPRDHTKTSNSCAWSRCWMPILTRKLGSFVISMNFVPLVIVPLPLPEVRNNRDLERLPRLWTGSGSFSKPADTGWHTYDLAVSREYFCRLRLKVHRMNFLEYLNSVRTMHLYDDLKMDEVSLQLMEERNQRSSLAHL